ncbi:MAG: FAD-binding protein [Xanthomonadales bacterium]|nr:FAD-binding protein [Xanthomonadales bacterium]
MSAAIDTLLSRLAGVLPADALRHDAASRIAYGYDNSRRQSLPDAVALPETAEQCAAIVAHCAELRVPLVARGRGTNTTGASVPIAAGLVLSCERMRRIIEVDPEDRVAVVEAGVLNGDLQQAAAAHGLFFAPDPTSAPFCSIGGNLACNAGGPRAVKYGAARDNTLALRCVDGRGVLHRLGSRTTKGATGYDLMRLVIGSEGTLAVIAEATLKLLPLPQSVRTLRALYRDVESAAAAVARIMRQPQIPCALEFMDAEAVRLAREVGGADLPAAGALLMIEVDGAEAAIEHAVAAVSAAARGDGLLQLDAAQSAAQVAQLWAARKALSPALKHIAPRKINEDVVVPVSQLPALVAKTRALAAASGIAIVCFGHAGNGNLHVNLMFDPANEAQAAQAPRVLAELFATTIALGGTLSGEHGIGLEKRDFMPLAIAAPTLELMRAVKAQFDPHGILNPGKLLPA